MPGLTLTYQGADDQPRVRIVPRPSDGKFDLTIECGEALTTLHAVTLGTLRDLRHAVDDAILTAIAPDVAQRRRDRKTERDDLCVPAPLPAPLPVLRITDDDEEGVDLAALASGPDNLTGGEPYTGPAMTAY